MSTLAEFLEEKAKQLLAEKPARDDLVREWTSAVNHLLDELEGWVRDADKARVLDIQRTAHQFNDEKMGRYSVPGLKFDLDGQAVDVVPVARRVVASIPAAGDAPPRRADGRVDLRRGADTFSVLYRARSGEADKWFVTHPSVWNIREQRQEVKPLTREEFERDLMSLFE